MRKYLYVGGLLRKVGITRPLFKASRQRSLDTGCIEGEGIKPPVSMQPFGGLDGGSGEAAVRKHGRPN